MSFKVPNTRLFSKGRGRKEKLTNPRLWSLEMHLLRYYGKVLWPLLQMCWEGSPNSKEPMLQQQSTKVQQLLKENEDKIVHLEQSIQSVKQNIIEK